MGYDPTTAPEGVAKSRPRSTAVMDRTSSDPSGRALHTSRILSSLKRIPHPSVQQPVHYSTIDLTKAADGFLEIVLQHDTLSSSPSAQSSEIPTTSSSPKCSPCISPGGF